MMLPMLPSLTNLAQLDEAVGVAARDDDLIDLPSLPVCTRSSLWEQARAAASAAAAVLITGPHAKAGPSGTAARENDAELEASTPDDGFAEAGASCRKPDMVRAKTDHLCSLQDSAPHWACAAWRTKYPELLLIAKHQAGTAMECKT